MPIEGRSNLLQLHLFLGSSIVWSPTIEMHATLGDRVLPGYDDAVRCDILVEWLYRQQKCLIRLLLFYISHLSLHSLLNSSV